MTLAGCTHSNTSKRTMATHYIPFPRVNASLNNSPDGEIQQPTLDCATSYVTLFSSTVRLSPFTAIDCTPHPAHTDRTFRLQSFNVTELACTVDHSLYLRWDTHSRTQQQAANK